MPDRETVIKAWECCNPFNRKCNECPYEKDCYHDGISRHMVADAISLLKEQEAESVIDIADPLDEIEVGRCPSCNKGIVNKKSDPTRYCKFCGQAVKWNE